MTALKTIVVFGRSPFINEVDCAALAERFDTAAINREPVPCDYLFSLFDEPQPLSAPQIFTHWEKPPHPLGFKIAIKASPEPFLNGETRSGFPCYAFQSFTASAVVNWAIRQGYERIILVGIDHVETDKQFTHWDGTTSANDHISELNHQALKSFIEFCSEYVEIFQTNPAVKNDWALPFMSIADLLAEPEL